MVCLYCGSDTHVSNSRLQKRQNSVWRRRTCRVCGSSFTTLEQPLLARSVLVRTARRKKLQPFSRDILFTSLVEACKHRPRAVIECGALVQTVAAKAMQSLHESVIERDNIVKEAVDVLSNFDTVAAGVYAACHPLDN